MDARPIAAALVVSLTAAIAAAQPLTPAARPSIAAEPLPAPAPGAQPPAVALPPERLPREATAPASDAPPPAAGRVFCEQTVSVEVADPAAVGERYRKFIGIWSDAAWSPTQCAALIVGSITPEGTAAITYAFGPMAANARGAGGILHGTGIIRDGELRFQNSDGSQYAFRPLYADLEGHLTTPQGRSYQAVFKKAP